MEDYGRKLSNKKLKALENKIRREYSRAVSEAQKKLDDYLKQFKKEDSEMNKKLLDGTITKKEYADWRSDKLMATNEWQFTVDSLNSTLENARTVAAGMMTDHVKDIYALNHNFAEYQIEKGLEASLSFNLYDASTVSRLMMDNPKMLPNPGKKVEADIKAGKVKRWNKKHIQSSMLQGVLQGESLPMIARRVSKAVGGMDERVAIRSARTMTTTAESAGRVDRYKAVQEMGIEMKKMWIAALDSHTRASHRHLDGEKVPVNEKFSNGLEYPGDVKGRPGEVYNCRCTIGSVIPGTDLDRLGIEGVQRNSRLGNMSYEDWKKERDKPTGGRRHQIVDGKDITDTWKRRPDKFKFDIEDVIDAQGFNGLPIVVGDKEFEAAVKESGVICKRGYTAPNEDVLRKYHNELINGNWYVDCSTGGAMYGQGMYSVAHKGTTLSESMERTVAAYASHGGAGKIETFTLAKDFKYVTDVMREKDIAAYEYAEKMIEKNLGRKMGDVEKSFVRTVAGISNEFDRVMELDPERKILPKITEEWKNVLEDYSRKKDELLYMDNGVFAAMRGYDAITIPMSGNDFYYVILNRTKVIFKGDK